MQQQVASYAFQLQEQCIATSLASHSKELIFYTTAYHPTNKISYLYTLKYNEQNPRKSILCAEKTDGKLHKIYNFAGFGDSEDNLASVISVTNGEKCKVMIGKCNREVNGSTAMINRDQIVELAGFEQISEYNDKITNFVYKTSSKSLFWNTHNDIYEYKENNKQICSVRSIGKQQGSQATYIKHLKIDPIHDYLTYSLSNNQIHILDKAVKNMKYQLQLSNAPYEPVLNLDYNRNKQYYLMSTHPSCIKFWDIRKPSLPVKLLLGQQSMHSVLLTAAYNISHDELIATGFDDGTVGLYRMTSVSSVPNKDQQDILVKLYDQHEDSAYCVEWSEYSPWVFSSVAYGAGNMVINLVPNAQKYRILL